MPMHGLWSLTIRAIPPSGNVLKRMFWAKYNKLVEDWYYLVRSAPGFTDIYKPTGKRWILILRYGRRKMDRENRYFSMKPVIDVLRPARELDGVYKSGKRKGQHWHRSWIGHGLIIDDSEEWLDETVLDRDLPKGEKPFIRIIISDLPIDSERF